MPYDTLLSVSLTTIQQPVSKLRCISDQAGAYPDPNHSRPNPCRGNVVGASQVIPRILPLNSGLGFFPWIQKGKMPI